jgi:large subunit ribosomal protein L9
MSRLNRKGYKMQIILLEKVLNVGQLGDVVKVKDGYARNFLIPQGKARRATAAAKAEFEARRAELEKAQAAKFAAAQAVAEKLTGTQLTIASKAGVDGRLFGSVTNADVAEVLKNQGFDVNKTQIKIVEAIKTIGEYAVQVSLFTDVTSDITVVVTPAV